jgi:predicted RNase H-like nuclease (RuvC/YqgF family)
MTANGKTAAALTDRVTEAQISFRQKGKRMRKNTMAGLLVGAALCLPLIGCADTKARQENEQLKAHVAELVKDNGDLGNQVDALKQENSTLQQENEKLKAKKTQTKSSKSKHHKHTTKHPATTSN